jgi:hypothetical protein
LQKAKRAKVFLEASGPTITYNFDDNTSVDVKKLCIDKSAEVDVYECARLLKAFTGRVEKAKKMKEAREAHEAGQKQIVEASDYDPDKEPISLNDLCTVEDGLTDEQANEVVYQCVRQLMWLKEIALRFGKKSWQANNDYAGNYAQFRNHVSDVANKDAFTIAFAANQSFVFKHLESKLKDILKTIQPAEDVM